MRLILDMNLSPLLVHKIRGTGIDATHWSELGSGTATDAEIADFARTHGYVTVSHDLDFSAILAATRSQSPSVIQIRYQDILSDRYVDLLLSALKQFSVEIAAGAIIIVDESRARARLLPIR